jgi:signal transduction histidine kinase
MAAPSQPLEEIRDILAEAINDLRNMSRSLHADQITPLDLTAAIEKELQRLNKTGLLNTSFTVKGEITQIDSSRKLILFRMIQEILQNIIKHSKSTAVNINLDFQKDFLILNIQDNGSGFDVNEKLKSASLDKGSGLLNLRNRANALQASMSIKSQPYEGTCITIKFPLLL